MSWNDVKKHSQKGDFLKLRSGEKARIHVLDDEPHTSYEIYCDDLRQGAKVPEGYKLPEPLNASVKHSVVVYNLDRKEVQILTLSQTTAEKFEAINESYKNNGGFTGIDVEISRKGDGFDTEYFPVVVPMQFRPEMLENAAVPDLSRVFAVSDEELIQSVIPGALRKAEQQKAERDQKKAKKSGEKSAKAHANGTSAKAAPAPAPAPAPAQPPASEDLDLPMEDGKKPAEPEGKPKFTTVRVVKDLRTDEAKKCPGCGKAREIKEGNVKSADESTGLPWGRVKVAVCRPCNKMEVSEKLPELEAAAA